MRSGDVTGLLGAASAGDRDAAAALYELVYGDLRGIAHRHLRGGGDDGLRTTSLVHEAYLRLARSDPGTYRDRVHFLSTASRAMRQILIDHARRRGASKRGGGAADRSLDAMQAGTDERDLDLLSLDAAIAELERDDATLARLVEWRFFGGLTVAEIAVANATSESTVKRDLREASAYLRQRMGATAA